MHLQWLCKAHGRKCQSGFLCSPFTPPSALQFQAFEVITAGIFDLGWDWPLYYAVVPCCERVICSLRNGAHEVLCPVCAAYKSEVGEVPSSLLGEFPLSFPACSFVLTAC
jgi:hypothetical protein